MSSPDPSTDKSVATLIHRVDPLAKRLGLLKLKPGTQQNVCDRVTGGTESAAWLVRAMQADRGNTRHLACAPNDRSWRETLTDIGVDSITTSPKFTPRVLWTTAGRAKPDQLVLPLDRPASEWPSTAPLPLLGADPDHDPHTPRHDPRVGLVFALLADPPEIAPSFWGVWAAGLGQVMGRHLTIVASTRSLRPEAARSLHRIMGLGPGFILTDRPLGRVLEACDAAIAPLLPDWPIASLTMISRAHALGVPVIVPNHSASALDPLGGADPRCVAPGHRPRDFAASIHAFAEDINETHRLGTELAEQSRRTTTVTALREHIESRASQPVGATP